MEAGTIAATISIADLMEDYLAACAAKNLSGESVKLYRIALDRFLRFVPSSDIASIDERLLRRYIFSMQSSGLSSSTVHDYYGAVQSLLKYSASAGVISNNPAAAVQKPKKSHRLPTVLSEAQSQALLDACPDWSWKGKRDKTAIFLLLGSGLRLSELLSLNLYDIDHDGFLRVIGKGDKERSVPIEDNVIKVLQDWMGVRAHVLNGKPHEALFINRQRGRMGKAFGQSVREIGKRAGFHCTPHALRHTFATDWIRGGGDSTTLRDILGHSNISITEKYISLAQKDFRQAASQYSITRKLRFGSRQMSLI